MNNKIIYLLRNSPKDLMLFKKSIELLKLNFLENNNYPIYVFNEDVEEVFFEKLNLEFTLKITSIKIKFELPDFLKNKSVPEFIFVDGVPSPFTLGYRHMCRFYAGEMYKHQALQDTDYYLRLDNDSFFMSKVKYDIFNHMKNNNLTYGYNEITTDNPVVAKGLWEKALDYSNKIKTIKKPITEIKHPFVYYTNFEIAKFNWFKNSEYINFYDFIDGLGGIYFTRWGDHAIKYLGIEMFLEDKYKHNFNDLNYRHGNIFNF